LQALTETTERAVRLGKEAVATQVQLSSQISGPLAEQLRRHSEAAGALANRLQEDLRASEEAVRKVHHHLIDASRFILSKVEYRRRSGGADLVAIATSRSRRSSISSSR